MARPLSQNPGKILGPAAILCDRLAQHCASSWGLGATKAVEETLQRTVRVAGGGFKLGETDILRVDAAGYEFSN